MFTTALYVIDVICIQYVCILFWILKYYYGPKMVLENVIPLKLYLKTYLMEWFCLNNNHKKYFIITKAMLTAWWWRRNKWCCRFFFKVVPISTYKSLFKQHFLIEVVRTFCCLLFNFNFEKWNRLLLFKHFCNVELLFILILYYITYTFY